MLFRWSYSSYSTEYGNWSRIRWWFQSKFYTQFSTQLWYGGTTWKCSRFKRIPAHVDRPILQRGLGPSNCWTWFSPNDQKTPTKAEKTTGELVYDMTFSYALVRLPVRIFFCPLKFTTNKRLRLHARHCIKIGDSIFVLFVVIRILENEGFQLLPKLQISNIDF